MRQNHGKKHIQITIKKSIKVFWLGFLADYMLKGKILLNMNTKQNKLLKSKHKSDNFSSESKIESENESDFL